MKKACAVHPAMQRVCDGTVTVLTTGVEFISNKMVPLEKEPLRQKHIKFEAERLNKQFGIPKEDTTQFHQDMKEIVTRKVFASRLATGGILLRGLSKVKSRIPPSLNMYTPETTALAIQNISKNALVGIPKIRLEFVNGRDLVSKLDYLEKYYKANHLSHPIDIEVYAKGELFLNIKRDFIVTKTASTAQAAAKTQAAANTPLLQLSAPVQKLLLAPPASTASTQANQVARIGFAELPKQEQIAQANKETLEKLKENNQKPTLTIVRKNFTKYTLEETVTGAPINPNRKIRVLASSTTTKFAFPPARVIGRIGPESLPNQSERALANKALLSTSRGKKTDLKLVWDKNNPPKPIKVGPSAQIIPFKRRPAPDPKIPKVATLTRIDPDHIPNRELAVIASKINLYRQLDLGSRPTLTLVSSQPQIPPVSPSKLHAIPIENRTITVKRNLSTIQLDVTLQKLPDNTLNIWVHNLKMQNPITKDFIPTSYRTDNIMFSSIDAFINLARKQKATTIAIQWVPTSEEILNAGSKLKQSKAINLPSSLSKQSNPCPVLEIKVYPQVHPIRDILSATRKPLDLLGKAFMRATDLDFKALSTTSFSIIGPPILKPAKANLKSKSTKLLQKIDELVKKDPGPTMHTSIEYNLDRIVRHLPDYAHVGSEKAILKLIMNQLNPSDQPIKTKSYKNEKTNSVLQISKGGSSYILRKADDPQYLLNEKVAFDLFESWNLNHLESSRVIAIGKFGKNYFLARTDLVGPTIYQGMEDLAEAALDSDKTLILLPKCIADNYKAGQVFGEIYRESIKYNQFMPQIEIDKLVGELVSKYNQICSFLKANGYPMLVDKDVFLTPLLTALQRNPLYYTHAIHDIHPGHFVRLENGKLGLFDAEEVAFSFDSQKNPITKPLHDYFVYTEQLKIQGAKLKLALQKILLMQNAIKQALISEGVPLEVISILEQLYALNKALDGIQACIGFNHMLLSHKLNDYVKYFNQIAGKNKPNEPILLDKKEITASWYRQEGEIAELKRGSYAVVKDEKGIYLSFHIDGLYGNGEKGVVKKLVNRIFNEAIVRDANRLYLVTEYRNEKLLKYLTKKYGLKCIEKSAVDSIYEIPFTKNLHYADNLAQSSLVAPALIQRGISLTRVRSEDIEKFKKALAEIYEDEAEDIIDGYPWKWFDSSHTHEDKNKVRVLAARDVHQSGSPAIGFIKLSVDADAVSISQLHVDETHRRKGIGTLLISYAYYFAKEHGCQSLQLFPKQAGCRLYQTLGFKIEGIESKLWKKLAPSEKLLAFDHTDKHLVFELNDLKSEKLLEKRLTEILDPNYSQFSKKRLKPAPSLPLFAEDWTCWDHDSLPAFKKRSIFKVKSVFKVKRELIATALLPKEQKRYTDYWKKFAPVQSTPYSTYRRYHPNGDIMQVTAYDKFGNKECQYDFPSREGTEPHKHPYTYNENNPRPIGVHGSHISIDRGLFTIEMTEMHNRIAVKKGLSVSGQKLLTENPMNEKVTEATGD